MKSFSSRTGRVTSITLAGVLVSWVGGCGPTLGDLIADSKVSDEQVLAALDKGSDPNALNADRRRPLGEAIAHGKLDIARRLLAKGADVNGIDRHRCTALDRVLDGSSGQAAISAAKLLLDNGAHAKDRYSTSAAAPGWEAGLVFGVDTKSRGSYLGPEWVDSSNCDKGSALARAAFDGNVELMELLIGKGADVNSFVDIMAAPPGVLFVVFTQDEQDLKYYKWMGRTRENYNPPHENGSVLRLLAENRNQDTWASQVKSAEVLLGHGAKLIDTDYDENSLYHSTIMEEAMGNGNLALAELLKQHAGTARPQWLAQNKKDRQERIDELKARNDDMAPVPFSPVSSSASTGSAGSSTDNRPACFGNTMCPVGTTCVHEVYGNGYVRPYCH